MNEQFIFVITSWGILIFALVIGTLFITWIVESAITSWHLWIEHRREKEIIQRLRERHKS